MNEFFKPYFEEKYPHENFAAFKARVQEDLESLIPTIPFIGGFKNQYTLYLVGGALVIALYKNLVPLGIEDEEFGKLIFEPLGDYLTPRNRIARFLTRVLIASPLGKYLVKRRSKHIPRFDHEWKMEYVEDRSDKDLIYIMKYTRCGLFEYMKEQGHENIAPYLCLLDYRMLSNLGIGFKRTQALAMGGSFCDFQFRRDVNTPHEWDSEQFLEYKQFLNSRSSRET